MAGPWEKFQSAQPQVSEQGPWTKFEPKPEMVNDGTVGPTVARGGTSLIKEKADQVEAIRRPGAFGDATDSILTGVPFGDEITAGMLAIPNAAINAVQGKGFDVGKEYTDAVGLERELQSRRNERSPVSSTVGGIAGGLGLGGAAAKGGLTLLQGAKPTLASLAGRGAAEGAGYGALYGAGEGEGLNDRVFKAATGAGVGTLAGGLGGSLARIGAGSKILDDAIPTVDQLKKASQAAYQAADDMGISFAPGYTKQLKFELANDLKKAGIDRTIHPKATAAFSRISEMAGKPVALSEVQTLRRVAQGAAASPEADERRIAQIMIDRLDKFVERAKPAQVIGGDAGAAQKSLREARDLWSRMRKTEMVQDALYGAEVRTAATGSGGNIDNASRQRLASLLLDKKKSRAFTPDERKALETVIKGSKTQNALRLAGKLSPQGNGLMTTLGVGGAMVNPAFGAASLGGMGAKTLADRMTGANAKLLEQVIRNGGASLPTAQLSALRKALTDALAIEGGKVAHSSID